MILTAYNPAWHPDGLACLIVGQLGCGAWIL
jgi:hypothetical protein